jgi:hypothetical protein
MSIMELKELRYYIDWNREGKEKADGDKDKNQETQPASCWYWLWQKNIGADIMEITYFPGYHHRRVKGERI